MAISETEPAEHLPAWQVSAGPSSHPIALLVPPWQSLPMTDTPLPPPAALATEPQFREARCGLVAFSVRRRFAVSPFRRFVGRAKTRFLAGVAGPR